MSGVLIIPCLHPDLYQNSCKLLGRERGDCEMVARWFVCSLLLVPTYAYLPGLPAIQRHRRQSHSRSVPLAVADLTPSAPPEAPKLTSRNADIAIAGIGLAGSIALLGVLQDAVGVKLFVPPMMASGIIFFAGPAPPNPKGFLFGTLCSCTLSVGLILLLQEYIPPVAADGVSAGVLLMWYKASGAMFPPAAVLAGTLAATIQKEVQTTNAESLSVALQFICFPWLGGHALLYAAARALAPVRSAARVSLSKDQFTEALRALTDDELKQTFDTFDTSGDGAIDAIELKVALKMATGAELDLDDCEKLVGLADADGTGALDFDEFKAVCRQEISL